MASSYKKPPPPQGEGWGGGEPQSASDLDSHKYELNS